MLSWRKLGRWGLVVLLVALVVHLFLGQSVASEETAELWSQRLFLGGGVLLGLATLLWLAEQMGLRVSGARCRDCKKIIQHGKLYCHDHLMKRAMDAREKLHGQRGMGI